MKKLVVSMIVIGFLAVVCYFYTAENISDFVITPDSTNSTRAFVSYQAKDTSKAVYAEYWEETKPERILKTATINQNTPLVLLGLNGEKTYFVRLVSDGNKSKEQKFITAPIPRSMLKCRWQKKLKEIPNGFILSQRFILRKKNPFGYVYMTDFAGDATWYQKVEGLPKISSFTEKKTVLVVSGNPQQERSAGNRLFEFDLLGNKILDLKLDSLLTPIEIHHDVVYDETGNLVAITYDKKEFKIKGKAVTVKGDAIVRMDTDGNILWRWSIFDAEDPTKSDLKIDSLGEWGHGNTLYIDSDKNYLLSFRDWNQIWKIDSKTGAVIWRLGENGTVKVPDGFSFSGQHSIHINKDGDFMMYDNGVKNKKSQILFFRVEENTRVVLKNKIVLPDELYSQKRGSAYFIDNERIIVCAPETGTIAIIDLKGNIIGKANTGFPDYYRAIYIPSLY